MQTKDHLALGQYLAQTFHIIAPVKRAAFVIGTIMPDINKCSYIRGYFQLRCAYARNLQSGLLTLNDHRRMLIGGHTAEGSRFYVNEIYRSLQKKKHLTVLDYYRLGKGVHYLADRFTYPHTMTYTDGFFSHIRYEKQLHTAMRKLLSALPDLRKNVDVCFKKIDFNGMYRCYRTDKDGIGTVLHDCFYIVAVCIAYLENILYNNFGNVY